MNEKQWPPQIDPQRIAEIGAEAKARAEAKAAQSAAQSDTVANSDDDLADIEKRILARRSACAEFEASFRATLQTNPPNTPCPRHPGIQVPVDVQASVLASWQYFMDYGERKRRWVLELCPVCAEIAETAARRAWMKAAGVPDILLDASLANWTPRNPADTASLAVIQRYAELRRGFLILISPGYGNGKSHLATALLRIHGKGTFRKMYAIMSEVRAGYGNGKAQRVVDHFSRTPFLVMDELGLTSGGRDELPVIHEILDARFSAKRPTVLTGNFRTADELEPIVGGRMYDRLRAATFAVVALTGPTERAKLQRDYMAD